MTGLPPDRDTAFTAWWGKPGTTAADYETMTMARWAFAAGWDAAWAAAQAAVR